jgi:Na+-translocating ferredoxin:NAD+ oxidoreductase subunit G
MEKNLSFRMIGVMLLITVVSGMILAGVWAASEQKIEQNMEQVKLEAMQSLNPTMAKNELTQKEGESLYKCYDQDGSLISYFFIAIGNGFQAPVKVAVAVDPSFKEVNGIRVLEQSETPGLGAKITENDFYDNFVKLLIAANPITCIKGDAKKDNGEIKAITSATISSKAVADLINVKIASLRKAGF